MPSPAVISTGLIALFHSLAQTRIYTCHRKCVVVPLKINSFEQFKGEITVLIVSCVFLTYMNVYSKRGYRRFSYISYTRPTMYVYREIIIWYVADLHKRSERRHFVWLVLLNCLS